MQESDDRSLVERLYRRGGDVDRGFLPGLVIARNVAAAVVILAVAVQIVVWAAVCIGTGQVTWPWWLWTLGGGVVLVALLWLLGVMMSAPPTSDHVRPGERSAQPWRFSWSWLFRLLVVLFIVSSVAQVVVWLVQGLLTGQLDTPWWTWSVLPFAVIVAAAWVLAKDETKRRDRDIARD